MSVLDVLILLAAIAAIAGIAVGMTRWSRRKYDELRHLAAASDASMQRAANALGLRFRQHAGYEHPFVGTVPAFAEIHGELDGVPGITRYTLEGRGWGSIGSGRYGTVGYGMGGGGSGYGIGSGRGIVTARKDFRATAVFSPALATDATERVTLWDRLNVLTDSEAEATKKSQGALADRAYREGRAAFVQVDTLLEQALEAELKARESIEWLDANAEAIASYNAQVAERGVFSDDWRAF